MFSLCVSPLASYLLVAQTHSLTFLAPSSLIKCEEEFLLIIFKNCIAFRRKVCQNL